MMTVRLIAHTPEPEKVVAAAAKLCYSDAHITDLLDGLTEEKTAKFLTMLSDLGHASPIEHASFTFGIEGVSRTLLAQITRHRIASFSVQSQRYVRLDDFRYVVPPEIEAIPEAKAAFLESMNEDAKRYLDLAHKLEEGHTARLMAEGMPEKAARAKAGKQANEDARFVLPNAYVPTNDRWLLVSPDTYALLLKSPEFIKASDLGDAVVQTGAVGRVAGFNVFEDTTLGDKVDFVAGHPNWFTRVEEWTEPVAVNDLKGSGTYIGACAVQGRKVYAHKVTKAAAILVKKHA